MSLGSRIAKERKAKHWTQEETADRIGVTFQAISSWERDQFQPSMDNLQKLAELFQIPIDTLLSDTDPQWLYREKLFDENHMYTFLKAKFQTLELSQALACLAFAREKHHGQVRKGDANIPYISHPLTMACHALAMGIVDDDVLASLLLHDVVEDTGTSLDELPANERVRKAVSLVSYNTYSGSKEKIRSIYYKNIKENPLACLIKCIDRCNNLSCMASGFTKKKMASYVVSTEQYVLPLIEQVKAVSEWNNAAWLLKYQMTALLETFKRLL